MSHEQLNNKPELKELRRGLRNEPTEEEALLWTFLKSKQLDGRKFRRQHSFGNYILDFYCPAEQLAIEIDGAQHYSKEGKSNDRERDLFLKNHGIHVIRFSNSEVTSDTQKVLSKIRSEFKNQRLPNLS